MEAGNRRTDAGARAGFPKRAGYSDRDIYRALNIQSARRWQAARYAKGCGMLHLAVDPGYPQPHAARGNIQRRFIVDTVGQIARGEAGR